MDTSRYEYDSQFVINRGVRTSWDDLFYSGTIPVVGSVWPMPVEVFNTERSKEDWFWTEEWQAGERKADEDIAQGRYSEVETVEELLVYLDGLEKEKEEEEG